MLTLLLSIQWMESDAVELQRGQKAPLKQSENFKLLFTSLSNLCFDLASMSAKHKGE